MNDSAQDLLITVLVILAIIALLVWLVGGRFRR